MLYAPTIPSIYHIYQLYPTLQSNVWLFSNNFLFYFSINISIEILKSIESVEFFSTADIQHLFSIWKKDSSTNEIMSLSGWQTTNWKKNGRYLSGPSSRLWKSRCVGGFFAINVINLGRMSRRNDINDLHVRPREPIPGPNLDASNWKKPEAELQVTIYQHLADYCINN